MAWSGVVCSDGTSLRVPDSEANRHEFGLIVGRLAPEGSGYPLMRAVALMALHDERVNAYGCQPDSRAIFCAVHASFAQAR